MTDFEKVLRETLSEETFKIISSSDKEFANWLNKLKDVADRYSRQSAIIHAVDTIQRKYRRIADFYGYEEQSRILQEECAELIQAVSKYHRFPNPTAQDKLVREIVDVQIMINQMLYLLNVDSDIYHEEMLRKLDRQLERIGGA